MTVTSTTQGYRVSTIVNNQLVSMHYIGYSKKEALKQFKIYLTKHKGK